MTRQENPSLYDQVVIMTCLQLSQHAWRGLPTEGEQDAATDAWIARQDQEELKLFINEVMVDPDKPVRKFAAWRP